MRKKGRFKVRSKRQSSGFEGLGYPPVDGEVTATEPVAKEHHFGLPRARADDRSTIAKEVSQCSSVLERFPRRYEPVQNNGNHVPVVDEHGILANLSKIAEKWIDPLVLRFRGRRDPEPYHSVHGLRDAVASGTKMSDDPGAVVEALMHGGAQFGVPGIGAPHPIR
ncbi:unnamed protein product [Sphagnum tenellum]|jgi:hypothetical protein